MPLDPELLSILVCPENRTAVRMATQEELSAINKKISAGQVKSRGGTPVVEPLAEALVRADGKVIYPIRDGIPMMLIAEGIEVD